MWQPKKICSYPGCGVLCDSTRCEKHTKAEQANDRERRGTSAERGYDSRWNRRRKAWLAQHPLCVTCESNGMIRASTRIDHIIPHRGDYSLFWDEENWQALCEQCHNRKTGKGK